jgi:hypothetical protein
VQFIQQLELICRRRRTAVADEEDDYEVGYGRPPRERQFRKGVSGNPKGRRTGSKNIVTLFNEIASELIPVTEGSKSRTVTRLEGVLRIQMNSALKGDHRAIKETLQMQRAFECQEQVEASAVDLSSRDEEIKRNFFKRVERMSKKPDQDGLLCSTNNKETK